MNKFCSTCKNLKSISDFNKNSSAKDGLQAACKECQTIYRLKYREISKKKYEIRKEKYKNEFSKYYKRHKKEISKKRRVYYKKNKLKILEYKKKYERKKIESDTNFKLVKCLRHRLYDALRGNFKSGSAVRDLGCTVEFLKHYLESKFQPGMTWENYGSYWHIDHIKPLSKFDLTDRNQLLEACHYTNLQPLEAMENIRKSNK